MKTILKILIVALFVSSIDFVVNLVINLMPFWLLILIVAVGLIAIQWFIFSNFMKWLLKVVK